MIRRSDEFFDFTGRKRSFVETGRTIRSEPVAIEFCSSIPEEPRTTKFQGILGRFVGVMII